MLGSAWARATYETHSIINNDEKKNSQNMLVDVCYISGGCYYELLWGRNYSLIVTLAHCHFSCLLCFFLSQEIC